MVTSSRPMSWAASAISARLIRGGRPTRGLVASGTSRAYRRASASSELRDDLLAPLADGLHADLMGDGAHLDHALDLVHADRLELGHELGGVVGGAVRMVDVELP